MAAHALKRTNAKFLLEVIENTDGPLEGVRSPSEALALEQRAAGYGRKAKSSLLSDLVNKVLLAHLFIDILSSVASVLQWHS